MSDSIVNKVAKSGILSLNIEEVIPEREVAVIDIADILWQGMVLREADLREWVKNHEWNQYRDMLVGVHCSADALIPTWAYMLIASRLTGIAAFVGEGSKKQISENYHIHCIRSLDRNDFTDARLVVKGCADRDLPPSVYIALTNHLQPVVKTLMFGEPCSTVPIYKQPRPSR